ncbi:S1C family serine protease [Harryflintia acetispora]|uniref:S1C family serine protease n=1 Tax=Harryflintia acetispora TaxID=1849041 RepID=UPI001898BFD7|nr:trypsin-like peptidase domain-containing protein [Harryflintia acetispora]
MNYYDDFKGSQLENSYSSNPQYGGAPQEGPKKRHNRGFAVAVALACVVSSSAMGFGGGYLAANLAGNQSAASQPADNTPTGSTVSSAPSSTGGVMSVSQIVSSVSDSVVEIRTEVPQQNFFMQPVTAQAAGSGVIISQDGYIVTNNHVIDGAQKITVRLKDGEETYDATLVGTDPQTDLAVIKIEAENLSAAVMGSSDSLQVGDETVAIGNPLGELGGTVTNGIVSALNREVTIDGETHTLIQTNAAINPGNSGGGLFNDKGELIGIVVAKSSGSGIEGLGFAIPVDKAKTVIEDLIQNGYVTGRGALGVSVIDIQDERSAFMYRVPQLGVYIAGVNESSAAQKAGLKVGDGIVAVGDAEISSSQELKTELEKYSAGETIKLRVLRDGETLPISVTLQENVPESVQQTEDA